MEFDHFLANQAGVRETVETVRTSAFVKIEGNPVTIVGGHSQDEEWQDLSIRPAKLEISFNSVQFNNRFGDIDNMEG